MTKKRLSLLDLGVLERLKDNADFQVFLDHIRDQVESNRRQMIKLIITPEDQANHNYLQGAINAFQVVVHLVESLHKQELAKLR